jgi:predicted nucleotidyltransferase
MARPPIPDPEELRRRLAPHLRRARTAILFGSAARGEADEWSDLDLLIYTPEEFARMRAEGNPLIERALTEGVVVHEAPAR